MDAEPLNISSEHIRHHVGYWVTMEKIRSEISGQNLVFDSDEEILDYFGVSEKYLLRAKKHFGIEYATRNPDSPFIN